MQFSCMGAKEAGGITVGVLPQDKRGEENEFCSVVIPTGMGYARDFINALSADAVIIIGGGAGTLSEMCAAYMYERPMVAIRGTGGMADEYDGKYMDYRKKFPVRGADTPEDAVKTALSLCGPPRQLFSTIMRTSITPPRPPVTSMAPDWAIFAPVSYAIFS